MIPEFPGEDDSATESDSLLNPDKNKPLSVSRTHKNSASVSSPNLNVSYVSRTQQNFPSVSCPNLNVSYQVSRTQQNSPSVFSPNLNIPSVQRRKQNSAIVSSQNLNIPSVPRIRQEPAFDCSLDFSETDILPSITNAEGISILKNIYKCFQGIKTKLETIEKKVDKQAQTRCECSGTHPDLSSFPFTFLPPEIELPVKTEAELVELNENIKINKDMTAVLVRYLHSVRTGKSPCSFVLSIYKKLMAQEVAVMYSRYGRKGKKSFSGSFRETQNVIIAAASLKFKNADEEALSDMFGKALAGASDWNGRQTRPSGNYT